MWSRVTAKIFVVLISQNFREIFNFLFRQISRNLAKFKIISSKFCVSLNFYNAVTQPPYVGVEEEGEGEWGVGGPSPYCSSASRYTVFHSVIFNSVSTGIQY